MRKRIAAIIFSVLLVLSAFPTAVFAAQSAEDIIILYENDVHCAVEGYAKLSAMKKDLQNTHAHVGVVSCGDYIQGNSLGVISQGEYIIHLMNLVGYDAVTLGNHEFDYRLPRLEQLLSMLDARAVCCNFRKVGDAGPYFEPYTIIAYGDVEIAYIGITTPNTIKTSSPTQFRDDDGEYAYTFQPTELYSVVQQQIDAARNDGADYVIALSHIGYSGDTAYGETDDIVTLIRNTTGLDVVLDAHSHSVIESKTLTDKGGNRVLLSSTGTKFEYIGKLTLSNGSFSTELVKTETYTATDPAVEAYIQQISEDYFSMGDRKVAYSEVELITHDADGNRLVRNAETNLGDLCSEAFRSAVDADIGYINGGGLRSPIEAGDVTFNDLLNVLPFNNTVVKCEISGQTIRDMLEMAMMSWPEEGSFPHVSGITFSVNTAIPSSVVLNEQEEFAGVSGQYRVYDVKVYNRASQKYEPLDLDKIYTLASHNYYLIEYGSGMRMLKDTKIIENEGLLDVEALELYITESLGGVIGAQYRQTSPNITYTEGEITTADGMPAVLWIVCAAVGGAAVAVLVVLLIRKRTRAQAT